MPNFANWTLRNQVFTWGSQTYLMGVLNVTPDSFSDGGQFDTLETAIAQAQHLVASGAHILDVGGQSARPHADEIPLEEELGRVIPVIKALRSSGISTPISVDTNRAAVARSAIEAGADWVNDISGGLYDGGMLRVIADFQVPVLLMHMRGTPKTMQQMTDYGDLMAEIYEFLARQAELAIATGVDADRIMVDPGIGFAKTAEQSLDILRQLAKFRGLGYPLLVGTSRKSFIGKILDQPDAQERVWGTAATCCAAIAQGADVLRVHDVKAMRDVCRVADAIWRRGA
jgi:dihydropteroate synthase